MGISCSCTLLISNWMACDMLEGGIGKVFHEFVRLLRSISFGWECICPIFVFVEILRVWGFFHRYLKIVFPKGS